MQEGEEKLKGFEMRWLAASAGVEQKIKGLEMRQQADSAKLEAEMKSGQIAAALKQMQMIFARMMRGELGVALQAMRIAMADEKRAREIAAQSAAADEQMAAKVQWTMRCNCGESCSGDGRNQVIGRAASYSSLLRWPSS